MKIKKGTKIVYLGSHLDHLGKDLTIGRIYTVRSTSDNYIWIVDDGGMDGGYGASTYKFELLKNTRKKKLEKLNENR